MATGRQCATRSTITPTKTCSANLYRCKLHINYPQLKALFLALKEFQDLCLNNIILIATDNTTVVAYINKDGGNEVNPPVCPTMENPYLVLQETGYSQSSTHFRLAECDRRQAIQARPHHPDRMVPPSRGLPGIMFPVAPASSGPVCQQVQQQTATLHITGT